MLIVTQDGATGQCPASRRSSVRRRALASVVAVMHDADVIIESDVPARLDRLPWSRFHTLVVVALGITWILDGLEVTIAGSIVGALEESPVLHFTAAQIGLVASAYLAGAVAGALVFGYLTDRLGRRKLFMVTLGLYLTATAATAFSWDFWSFALFRVLTGAGIGGEYAAINSAIQELIPARYRGRTDLAVNGSFWVGAALGALGAVVLLQPGLLPPDWGWRAAFGIGAGLGLGILLLRRWIPESPRWLMLRGRLDECETVIAGIELRVGMTTRGAALLASTTNLRIVTASHTPILRMMRAILRDYPRRAVLGLILMASQAFFYNAIFFSYALVLTRFYAVPSDAIGWYILPFALGNFLGPLLLGHLFDTLGRKPMIAFTYAISGVLLAIVGYLFRQNLVDAATLTVCWCGIFFFASAAASAAYLTVSESFPLEARALAIAFFYAVGTAIGGVASPWLFGILVGTGERGEVFLGYLFGAALMIGAAAVELAIGIKAERQPLEAIARPLSSVA
jgi:MFS family permease